MKEYKEIFRDVESLYNKITFLKKEEEKIIFIIKCVFLKYLIENNIIKYNGDLRQLKNKFTINSIIELWSGEKYNYLEENECIIDNCTWDLVLEFISFGTSLFDYNSIILGSIFEYINKVKVKKSKGIFYTPSHIVKQMITLSEISFNSQIKVIDPSCGSGFFLSQLYDTIMKYHQKLPTYYDEIKKDIHHRIISKQIYGIEKDKLSSLICKLVLNLKTKEFIPINNILNRDTLLDDIEEINNIKFDLVIGNPPYIGHKQLDMDYSNNLRQYYGDVFYDKGDISYCFFKNGLELLKENGKLIYITSRYFLESLNGRGLRKYLKNNALINKIVDFNGIRVIEGAKVDLAMIMLTRSDSKFKKIDVYKMKENIKANKYKKHFEDFTEKESKSFYINFSINQNTLDDDGWQLIDKITQKIIKKINKNSQNSLDNICNSYQGIISGCDKAFVIESDISHNFSPNLLKSWIKNTHVKKYNINSSKKYLIYADDIDNIENYENEYEHLFKFKNKLENRRECKKGSKKWYQLQWGRKKEIFNIDKIIFPYKASNNRFAIDTKSCFFSADIYALILKNNLFNNYTYEFLVCLLNSKLYELYYKTFAKKLGADLYEYYPNTLMRLKVPNIDNDINKQFKLYYHKIRNEVNDEQKINEIKKEIDNWFYDFFSLESTEIDYIEEKINNYNY